MSAATQDTFDDILTAVAHDTSLPIKGDSREAVRVAVMAAARKHGWRITAANLREFYPAWIVPEQIGPTLRRLRLRGYLVVLSHNARYGSAGNGDKFAPVYRVTGAIPAEAVQP